MKLMYCPFCGLDKGEIKTDPLRVECQDCGARGPEIKPSSGETWSDAQRKAAEHWNTRHRH